MLSPTHFERSSTSTCSSPAPRARLFATFKRWEAQPGEVLIINSSELRAVQGTAMEFILRLLIPQVQPLRRSPSARVRGGAQLRVAVDHEIVYPPSQKWVLEKAVDAAVRRACL